MTDVHYFPRYSQPENFVTNNTLLLLQRLHDTNRFKFDKFLASIYSENVKSHSIPPCGLQFKQQISTTASVTDGFISQGSIKIVVETKTWTPFNIVQAVSHLDVFKDEQFRLLLLLSPSQDDLSAQMLEGIEKAAMEKSVEVLHLTFQDIIDSAKVCFESDEETLALLSDYESFCSERSLLPRDQYTMLVPPCGATFDDNKEFALYYCPVTRNLRKTKYLGIYRSKCVELIGTITKTIASNVDTNNKSLSGDGTEELSENEKQRIIGAVLAAKKNYGWDISSGCKFLLVERFESTKFEKTTSGGIMGHRYIDLERIMGAKPQANLGDIATELRKFNWQ